MATLRERPTRWGSACLFPYPGRIKEGRFRFRGREVQLPVDGRDGNAIHGVVRTRPWRITSLAAGDDGASVTARISTAEERVPTAEWPWPFGLALTISLRGGVLRVATEVQNDGAEPMPFGLGFHPYFPTPFGPGEAERCEVWIEADEKWAQEVACRPARWYPSSRRRGRAGRHRSARCRRTAGCPKGRSGTCWSGARSAGRRTRRAASVPACATGRTAWP